MVVIKHHFDEIKKIKINALYTYKWKGCMVQGLPDKNIQPINDLKIKINDINKDLNPYNPKAKIVELFVFTDKYSLTQNSHTSQGCIRLKWNCLEAKVCDEIENMPVWQIYSKHCDHRSLCKYICISLGPFIKHSFEIFDPQEKKLVVFQLQIKSFCLDTPERCDWSDSKNNNINCDGCGYSFDNILETDIKNIKLNDYVCGCNKSNHHALKNYGIDLNCGCNKLNCGCNYFDKWGYRIPWVSYTIWQSKLEKFMDTTKVINICFDHSFSNWSVQIVNNLLKILAPRVCFFKVIIFFFNYIFLKEVNLFTNALYKLTKINKESLFITTGSKKGASRSISKLKLLQNHKVLEYSHLALRIIDYKNTTVLGCIEILKDWYMIHQYLVNVNEFEIFQMAKKTLEQMVVLKQQLKKDTKCFFTAVTCNQIIGQCASQSVYHGSIKIFRTNSFEVGQGCIKKVQKVVGKKNGMYNNMMKFEIFKRNLIGCMRGIPFDLHDGKDFNFIFNIVGAYTIGNEAATCRMAKYVTKYSNKNIIKKNYYNNKMQYSQIGTHSKFQSKQIIDNLMQYKKSKEEIKKDFGLIFDPKKLEMVVNYPIKYSFYNLNTNICYYNYKQQSIFAKILYFIEVGCKQSTKKSYWATVQNYSCHNDGNFFKIGDKKMISFNQVIGTIQMYHVCGNICVINKTCSINANSLYVQHNKLYNGCNYQIIMDKYLESYKKKKNKVHQVL